MRLALRLARREMRGGLAGFRVFLIVLALGVASIAGIGTLRDGIRAGLAAEGAALIGGDARIEFTYRAATAAEKGWMAGRARAVSEVTELRSMARAGAESALTQLKAVDGAWPLLGAAVFDPPMRPAEVFGPDGRGAAMDPVLAARLGLRPGDSFDLGEGRFRLAALLLREPDGGTGGFELGPRTLVSAAGLAQSGLLAPGAMFETSYRMTLPPGADLGALQAAALRDLAGSGLDWDDARRPAPGLERFVERMGAFLVLVGLAGLAVGGVGIAQAVSAWAERKTATIATLRSLGADGALVRRVVLLQVAAVSALGIGLGLGIGIGLPLLFSGPIAARLPFPVALGVSGRAAGEAALYGALVAALFALWPLARMLRLRPAALYRAAAPLGRRVSLAAGLAVAGLAGLLVLAAVLLSAAPALAAATLAGIAGALGALALVAAALRAGARAAARRLRGRPLLRTALAALGAARGETTAAVLALGLGLSVLAAVGQVDAGLRGAIARDLPGTAPAFFLLDILPDQEAAFARFVAATPAITRTETAPMLRGRVTAIDGRAAADLPEHWVLRGDRGLSFAARPPASAPLVAGAWWPEGYTGPPQVSFAAEEARELGIGLGSEITVNVLGRDITARVTSLRDVDFSRGGMGFVMVFDPGAFAGAPHASIATLYADPAAEAPLLRALAREFPAVTAIRVRDAIDRASEAMAALARATALAASVTLATGLAVLVGAAAAGQAERAREAALLKVLGATRAQVLGVFALRSGLAGLAAALVALGVGFGAAWAVIARVMDLRYIPAFGPGALVLLGGVGLTLLAGALFALRPLAARPARHLRGED